MTSQDLRNAISLQGLVDGARLLKLQDGEQTSLYGPVAARASRSAWPAEDSAPQTSVTFGLSLDALLRTATLQSSLESRLQARMAANGSLEYDLTWKRWDMESGPPICALRAQARKRPYYWLGLTDSGENLFTQDRHISASVCSGWPSVRACEGSNPPMGKDGRHMGLTQALVGWPTMGANDHKQKCSNPSMAQKRIESGKQLNVEVIACLAGVAIAGWTTVKSSDTSSESWETKCIRNERHLAEGRNGMKGVGGMTLPMQAVVAGWVSPTVTPPRPQDTGIPLSQQVYGLAGWATTTTNDAKNNAAPSQFDRNSLALNCQAVIASQSSPVATGKRGVLNPDLCRWLMGYPAGWHLYAVTATPSILV